MIPGKIFTGFAKFRRIVSVNDFELPIRLQELLQAPLCFLRSFCLARIRLDPLGGHVLHHDCKSMIASRFTTFTENFVICCNQITKIFCTKYDSANVSSAQGPCNFGSLANLEISVFGEVSNNTVLTQIHTSRRRRLQRRDETRRCTISRCPRSVVITACQTMYLKQLWAAFIATPGNIPHLKQHL